MFVTLLVLLVVTLAPSAPQVVVESIIYTDTTWTVVWGRSPFTGFTRHIYAANTAWPAGGWARLSPTASETADPAQAVVDNDQLWVTWSHVFADGRQTPYWAMAQPQSALNIPSGPVTSASGDFHRPQIYTSLGYLYITAQPAATPERWRWTWDGSTFRFWDTYRERRMWLPLGSK